MQAIAFSDAVYQAIRRNYESLCGVVTVVGLLRIIGLCCGLLSIKEREMRYLLMIGLVMSLTACATLYYR